MTDPVFSRILVPTNFSLCAEAAWGLAQRLPMITGVELVLLHVLAETPLYSEIPWTMGYVKDVYAAAHKWVKEALETWVARTAPPGYPPAPSCAMACRPAMSSLWPRRSGPISW
jgi:hypothetical protein